MQDRVEEPRSDRRTVLTTGLTTTAGGLAGCASDGSQSDPTDSLTEATTEPTATEGATETVEQAATPEGSASFDSLSTERLNGRIEVTTDDDLVAKLNGAEEGDALVLSSGTHEVEETLRRDANRISLFGQGNRSTVIRRTGDFPLLELHGDEGDHAGAQRRRHWTFENLRFATGDGHTSDLVNQRWSEGHRWSNVSFDGYGTTGNALYAEQCWDQTFVGCVFSGGGDPERGTADIYWYNTDVDNTNNWRFVNCRWEKLNSHAIYSDNTGGGGPNGRLFLVNCKMHGYADVPNAGSRKAADVYPVDLAGMIVKISNSLFTFSRRGWIRMRNEMSNTAQIVNNAFRNYKGTCLQLESKENYVSNNSFWSRASHPGRAIHLGPEAGESALVSNVTGGPDPSIHVEADRTAITGNVIDFDGFFEEDVHAGVHGIVVSGEDTTLGQNVVANAGGDGIRFEGANGTVATGNVVREPSGLGIVATEGTKVLIANNAVRGAETAVDAPDAEVGTTLTL